MTSIVLKCSGRQSLVCWNAQPGKQLGIAVHSNTFAKPRHFMSNNFIVFDKTTIASKIRNPRLERFSNFVIVWVVAQSLFNVKHWRTGLLLVSFIELWDFMICQLLNMRTEILSLATSLIAHLWKSTLSQARSQNGIFCGASKNLGGKVTYLDKKCMKFCYKWR